jgi:hypothetical protein
MILGCIAGAAMLAHVVSGLHVDPVPMPSPVTTTSPATAPTLVPVLAGITLGEEAKGVLRRFNLAPMGHPSVGALVFSGGTIRQERIFPANVGDVVIYIMFGDRINAVMVSGTSDSKGRFADPFGVKLGDSPERLVKLRGNPEAYGDNGDVRYGPPSGIHWFFSVREDKISTIGVADGS